MKKVELNIHGYDRPVVVTCDSVQEDGKYLRLLRGGETVGCWQIHVIYGWHVLDQVEK